MLKATKIKSWDTIMIKFFYKDIEVLLRTFALISVVIITWIFLPGLLETYISRDIYDAVMSMALVGNIFVGFILCLGIFVLGRTLLKQRALSTTKAHDNNIKEGINHKIAHPCRDEMDVLLVKLGGLYSISDVGNGNKSGKNYINSIEKCDIHNSEMIDSLKISLSVSYDIDNKKELYSTLIELLDPRNFGREDATLYASQLDHLSALAKRCGIELFPSKKSVNISAAFNLQRAAMLMRSGISCGFLTMQEWDELKKNLCTHVQEQFSSLDELINDYLLAVYLFYTTEYSILGPSRIMERLYGITELKRCNYFGWDITEMNHPSL